MPDAYGRPTLQDWAGVTGLVNDVVTQRRASEAEQRETQTAQLSNYLAGEENAGAGVKIGEDIDPRVALAAKAKALAMQSAQMQNQESAIALRARQYQRDRDDALELAKQAEAYDEAGEAEKARDLLDQAYPLIPDGQHIVSRKGDEVVLATATGKEKKFKDTMSNKEKIDMVKKLAADPVKWHQTADAVKATHREINMEAWANPEPVLDKKGAVLWKVHQVDPKSNRPSILFFDHFPTETSNPIKVEGDQGFMNLAAENLKYTANEKGRDGSDGRDRSSITLNQALDYLEGAFYKTNIQGQVEILQGKTDAQYNVAKRKFYQLIHPVDENGNRIDKDVDVLGAALVAEDFIDKIEDEYIKAIAQYPKEKAEIDRQFKDVYDYIPTIPKK